MGPAWTRRPDEEGPVRIPQSVVVCVLGLFVSIQRLFDLSQPVLRYRYRCVNYGTDESIDGGDALPERSQRILDPVIAISDAAARLSFV